MSSVYSQRSKHITIQGKNISKTEFSFSKNVHQFPISSLRCPQIIVLSDQQSKMQRSLIYNDFFKKEKGAYSHAQEAGTSKCLAFLATLATLTATSLSQPITLVQTKINMLITVGWIAIKIGLDIHGSQRTSPSLVMPRFSFSHHQVKDCPIPQFMAKYYQN